jgi:hypothetical protein
MYPASSLQIVDSEDESRWEFRARGSRDGRPVVELLVNGRAADPESPETRRWLRRVLDFVAQKGAPVDIAPHRV